MQKIAKPTKAQAQAWLKDHGCTTTAQLADEHLLNFAKLALVNGLDDEDINLKWNSFPKFDASTPITDAIDSLVTTPTRKVDWQDPQKNNAVTPLFFNDISINDEHKGSCAMSFEKYSKEMPKEGSVLSVRTYKTKTGEIRASVN